MRSDLFTTGSLIGPFIGINSVNTDVTLRIPDSSTITASWCSCHQPPGKPGKMAESGHGMKWNTSGNILIGSPWIRFESFGTEQRGSLLEGNLFHVRAGYRTDLWIHIIDFTIMLGSQSFTSLTIVFSFLLLNLLCPGNIGTRLLLFWTHWEIGALLLLVRAPCLIEETCPPLTLSAFRCGWCMNFLDILTNICVFAIFLLAFWREIRRSWSFEWTGRCLKSRKEISCANIWNDLPDCHFVKVLFALTCDVYFRISFLCLLWISVFSMLILSVLSYVESIQIEAFFDVYSWRRLEMIPTPTYFSMAIHTQVQICLSGSSSIADFWFEAAYLLVQFRRFFFVSNPK